MREFFEAARESLKAKRAALADLKSKRASIPGSDYRAMAEKAVLTLIGSSGDGIYLCPFSEASLWLADHRLEERDKLRASGMANYWDPVQAKAS